jgi:hypothetical protein
MYANVSNTAGVAAFDLADIQKTYLGMLYAI